MVKDHSDREREMFYLTTHSTHFMYGYMASDIWLRTILIVRKERERERERKMFYLTTHSTHFMYGYMASDIWLRTILIVRKRERERERERERAVLFNDALNTFYVRLYGVRHMVKDHSDSEKEREREMFYLTTHSTHFMNGYMASDIWLRTILIVRKEREREKNVLFNDALHTFYVRLYGVRHMAKDHSDSEKGEREFFI